MCSKFLFIIIRSFACSDLAELEERERESGSTDPERFATGLLGLAIGCCFTLPPENPDTNGVRFRSEQRPAGRKRRALACSMGYPSAPSKLLCRHHTAVPRPKRAAGVQCRHCHRPAGNFVAATDGVNESRTPSGTAPGARAEPVKPCPAFTLSGGPAPSRVGEFARKLRMHCQAFPAPPRQFCR